MLGPGNGTRRRHDQAAELRPRLTLTTRGELETTAQASAGDNREAHPRSPGGLRLHCPNRDDPGRQGFPSGRPAADLDRPAPHAPGCRRTVTRVRALARSASARRINPVVVPSSRALCLTEPTPSDMSCAGRKDHLDAIDRIDRHPVNLTDDGVDPPTDGAKSNPVRSHVWHLVSPDLQQDGRPEQSRPHLAPRLPPRSCGRGYSGANTAGHARFRFVNRAPPGRGMSCDESAAGNGSPQRCLAASRLPQVLCKRIWRCRLSGPARSVAMIVKGLAATVVTVLALGPLSVPAFAAAESGGMSGAGEASAGTGSNTAAGNQSTSAATTTDVLRDLAQPILLLVFPQNDSSGSANINAQPATVAGDAASGSVSQASGAGSGRLQSGSVRGAGSAVSSTPDNTAIGNQLTDPTSAPAGEEGPIAGGGGTIVSACTVSNTYTNPGVLGLLAPQFQSGPVHTVSCVPAAVAGGSGDGATIVSTCTVSNTYTDPGVLDLLGSQFQSGPVQTMTCVPAVVATGRSSNQSLGAATIKTGASTAHGNTSDGSASSHRQQTSVTGRLSLPRTGADLLGLGKVAGLLIGLGLLVMRAGRDRDCALRKVTTRAVVFDWATTPPFSESGIDLTHPPVRRTPGR